MEFREKLSEKGCGRRSKREFGGYTETKMGRKVPFRWPVRLPCRRIRDFRRVSLGTWVNRQRGASRR